MIQANLKGDMKVFDKLLNGELFKTKATPVIKIIAQEIIDDIRGHWSPIVPSNWGDPPAVRTGNLDRSIRKGPVRNWSGRFAKDGLNISIYVEASYSDVLEYGWLYRPFFEPALDRAAERFDVAFIPVFRGL